MSLPKQINGFSTTIARRTDNLHAFIYTTDFGSTNQLQLFTSLNDLRSVNFTGMPVVSALVAEFTEDVLVMSDIDSSGSIICEYQVNESASWSPISTHRLGNNTTIPKGILRLKSGGIVIIGYQHDGSITLNTAYRNPSLPPAPGVSYSQWAIQNFVCEPGPGGIPSINLSVSEGPDGLIYAHFSRDGSHRIKRARFKVENYQLTLVDFDGEWASDYEFNGIPKDGEMSPDMEFPYVCSRTDWANNRILVSYAQSRIIFSDTYCENVNTRPVVVADQGDSKSLVLTVPEVIDRSTSPNPIIIVSGNLYVLYNYVDPSDCAYHWKMRVAVGDPFTVPIVDSGYTHFCAVSDDGWMCVREPDGIVSLFKLPLIEPSAPVLTIEKIDSKPPQVKVSWGDSNYLLQGSSDLKNWVNVDNQTNPMWFECTDKQFWRLVKIG